MAVPRCQQISLDHTPYYHCTTRCVRRAFLCGKDRFTGKSFAHRKTWMEQRLVQLSKVFAIDLLAYAIMSNHYHVVVRLDSDKARRWSDEDVISRWAEVFAVPDTVTADNIAVWRERLCSLSWYMRCLNEPLARRANREDRCKGRFWEGRFTCQALLDEAALLKCMTYVDLNPIRAAVASTPELSDHTSVKARIDGTAQHLAPFSDQLSDGAFAIPLRHPEYLALVDWSGRQMQSGKRGRIPDDLQPFLQRLAVDHDQWIAEMKHYGRWYYRAVGSVATLERYCKHLGQSWLKGKTKAAVTFV